MDDRMRRRQLWIWDEAARRRSWVMFPVAIKRRWSALGRPRLSVWALFAVGQHSDGDLDVVVSVRGHHAKHHALCCITLRKSAENSVIEMDHRNFDRLGAIGPAITFAFWQGKPGVQVSNWAARQVNAARSPSRSAISRTWRPT